MLQFFIKKTFFLLLITLPFCLFAQDKQDENETEKEDKLVLTIEDAVNNAKEKNLSLKDAELVLKTLEIKNKYSWNSVSPTLGATGSFTQDFENDSNSLGISGTVGVSLSTNLYTQIQGARLDYEKGLITYEQSCNRIEKQVRQSFYALLYKQEYLKLQERNLQTSLTQYRNNQEKYKSGKISELDVKTSQVNYQQKKPTVEQAQIDLTNDIAAFKQILGLDQTTQIELTGSLDDVLNIKNITLEELPEASEPAPDIRIAEKNLESAKNTLLSNRFSAYAPSISATYTYGKTKQSTLDDLQTTNRLSVGVNIPIDGVFPWSIKSATIAAQKNNLETSKNALETAKTNIQVQTESYLRKINQAIMQVESLKANAALAEETYAMTRTAYNYGKTDFLTLQNASDNVLSAGVSLKQQAYSLISSILELEYLLGIDFGTLGK